MPKSATTHLNWATDNFSSMSSTLNHLIQCLYEACNCEYLHDTYYSIFSMSNRCTSDTRVTGL